jgi:TPR repeat protein
MYLTGQGVEQNKPQAVIWYHKSARQGNANAMYNLGAAYYNGDGVPVNDSFSYAWFTLAKEAGSQRAVEAVQRAESELRPLAITDGFKKIAEMYEKGEYLPENQAEAARWWLKAATRGDQDAQAAIAIKLINGQGVPQDLAQGRYWCSEAAKQDNAPAEYCMGYMYQRGLGVTRDAKQARKWYERAATRGNISAIKTLALMEATGEGGKTDRLTACLLYARLAATGDNEALRSLAKLKKEIGAKEWKKVQEQLPRMRISPEKLDTALQQVDPQ